MKYKLFNLNENPIKYRPILKLSPLEKTLQKEELTDKILLSYKEDILPIYSKFEDKNKKDDNYRQGKDRRGKGNSKRDGTGGGKGKGKKDGSGGNCNKDSEKK